VRRPAGPTTGSVVKWSRTPPGVPEPRALPDRVETDLSEPQSPRRFSPAVTIMRKSPMRKWPRIIPRTCKRGISEGSRNTQPATRGFGSRPNGPKSSAQADGLGTRGPSAGGLKGRDSASSQVHPASDPESTRLDAERRTHRKPRRGRQPHREIGPGASRLSLSQPGGLPAGSRCVGLGADHRNAL